MWNINTFTFRLREERDEMLQIINEFASGRLRCGRRSTGDVTSVDTTAEWMDLLQHRVAETNRILAAAEHTEVEAPSA